GSTGQPKGVMIQHQGLVNYLTWATRVYRFHDVSGSLVHSPLAFDLTVTSLFGPLIGGGGHSLPPLPPPLVALCAAPRPGGGGMLVKLTPSHLDLLAHELSSEELQHSVHTLVVGGEQLRGPSVRSLRKECPTIRIINEYGPTEAVVGCCTYEVDDTTDLAN